jgi:hypothetical protein
MRMNGLPARRNSAEVIDTRKVRCTNLVYDVSVTGFYTDDGVMNVEFFYTPSDFEPEDVEALRQWQANYVSGLGRRVA